MAHNHVQLHLKVLNIFFNVWESIEEYIYIMLSTICFLHNSWESGHVNLIFSPDIADGKN